MNKPFQNTAPATAADVGRQARIIGGSFALAIEDIPLASDSIWSQWTSHFAAAATFATARAALGALIGALAPRRIWLPAYYCPETSEAVASAASEIRAEVAYYGVTRELDPDVGYFEGRLGSAELVLVVDYFGWPPSRSFRDWITTRSDVVWVEDRAHALWTTEPPWAPWCVFSARKLLGVPNGGMLVGPSKAASLRPSCSSPDPAIALPELLRLEDCSEAHDDQAYAAYKERERRFHEDSGPMARLTEALLRRIPIAPLVAARQTNYRYLLKRLHGYAAWPRSGDDIAPYGLVIAVKDPQSLQRQLAEERLFCARHWPESAADRANFPSEQRLSDQLLTLPCDHRYAPETLARLADAIERLSPDLGYFRA